MQKKCCPRIAGDRQPSAACDIALVCMPFYIIVRPSIQIGLLRAIAQESGFRADTYHLNLELAARLQFDTYGVLCGNHNHLICEWLFSKAAFGEAVDADDQRYFEAFPEVVAWAEGIGFGATELSKLRHEVLPRFIEDCLAMVDWGRYRAVGFSSTFQQQVASLALARRIKERYPHVAIIFGGANMVGEMGVEYLRAFPFIDYAVLGDGDHAFPALLEYLAKNLQPESLSGVALRTAEGITVPKEIPPFTDLDTLPTPDYDEYFERATHLGITNNPKFTCGIPFESSRGCWWGQKHQCKFCGFTQMGIKFRSKKARRVLKEVTELARRYGITFFQSTDSIMDMDYVNDLFVPIEHEKLDYQFYYETKSNLTHEQLRTLYRGGVRLIQPGIESLSTHVLGLMRKGCTMLQNIRFLKWSRYYGMQISWNLLWGFPGETAEDYRRELEVLELISHLDPPNKSGRIWLERYSPYFSEPESRFFTEVRAQASYKHVYPASLDIENIAFFFDYSADETLPDEIHYATKEWIAEWSRRWQSGRPDTLSYRRTADSLLIDDRRLHKRVGTHSFYGPLADMYEFCGETMRTVRQVTQYFARSPQHHEFPEREIEEGLYRFCTLGLMVSENGRYLSLALPKNPNW